MLELVEVGDHDRIAFIMAATYACGGRFRGLSSYACGGRFRGLSSFMRTSLSIQIVRESPSMTRRTVVR